MQWMNDRVTSVNCLGSGHHYKDPRGIHYENEDTTLTLCKLASGGLVQLRLDMLSNRPHNMAYYSLQGTKGCYEAPRGPSDQHKIWLAERSREPSAWQPLSDYESFLPEPWKNPPPEAKKAGHGGGDFWVIDDFVAASRAANRPQSTSSPPLSGRRSDSPRKCPSPAGDRRSTCPTSRSVASQALRRPELVRFPALLVTKALGEQHGRVNDRRRPSLARSALGTKHRAQR